MCKEQNRSADIKNELAAKSRATGIKEQVLAEINKLAETYQIKKVEASWMETNIQKEQEEGL